MLNPKTIHGWTTGSTQPRVRPRRHGLYGLRRLLVLAESAKPISHKEALTAVALHRVN
jgi:hypothetical protein